MEKTIKGKFEYCHVFSDRIVITKSPEIEDLVMDYSKTLKDFFKTLTVFFIFIPIFTALSVVVYYQGLYTLAVYAGAFALLFLGAAIYSMLFTSAAPVIYREKIVGVNFKKHLIMNGFEIRYKEFGLTKKRGLAIGNNQLEIDSALKIFLDEKLIENKDISMNGRKIEICSHVTSFILFASAILLLWLGVIAPIPENVMNTYGLLVFLLCGAIVPIILRKMFTAILGR